MVFPLIVLMLALGGAARVSDVAMAASLDPGVSGLAVQALPVALPPSSPIPAASSIAAPSQPAPTVPPAPRDPRAQPSLPPPAADSAAGVPESGSLPSQPPTLRSDAGTDAHASTDEDDDVDAVVRVGSDYALRAGEAVGDIAVIMGSATVDGRVAGDLVVVLGDARLGPAAVVEGDLIVVGGSLTVQSGAAARGEVVVVGGTLSPPADFKPGGGLVVVGFKALGDAVRGLLPWLTRGLLLARPVVPDLPWVWGFVGVSFLVYLGVLLVFAGPVRTTADILSATPVRSLAAGLVVLILAGPIFLVLVASVVGLVVVPFAVCAIMVAGVIGKTAAARCLGDRLLPEASGASGLLLVRSFAIGCAVLVLAYMVPVLGGAVWATVSAAGLGAAALAFVDAYRHENPPADPRPGAFASSSSTFVSPVGNSEAAAGQAAEPVLRHPESAVLPESSAAAASAVLVTFPRASFTDRLAAFALDAILIGLAIMLVDPIDDSAFVPIFLVYRSAFWAWKATTVGGIICQTRIVRVDGAPLGPAEALVRGLGSIFSVAVFGIGCLWVLRDADRQSWHDQMAGTYVVKVPRNWPL
jgi:uncharacterized RDD family membrane protein YckC